MTPRGTLRTLPTGMKHLVLSILIIVATLGTSFAAGHEASGPYRHVVCFKFKDDATKEQVSAIEKAFAELPKKIDTINGFEWGTDVSPEGLAQGYTHCFIVSFKDKAGLEVYIPHEAHKEFVAQLKPILDKVFVIDFVGSE